MFKGSLIPLVLPGVETIHRQRPLTTTIEFSHARANTCTPSQYMPFTPNKQANWRHIPAYNSQKGGNGSKTASTRMAFDVYSDKLCRVNDVSSSFTCPSTHTTSHYQSGWNVARLTELLWEEWAGRLALVGTNSPELSYLTVETLWYTFTGLATQWRMTRQH